MPISRAALSLLDRIESLEMRSLEWGFTEGSLEEAEVSALARAALASAGSDLEPDDVLEELLDSRLAFEFHNAAPGVRIRSRFGEMMRLLAANRQLLPNRPWQTAPHLVADFRVDRRPRRFPRRDLSPDDILRDHVAKFAPDELRLRLWQALTARAGFRLAGFQQRALLRIAAATGESGTIITAGTGSGKTNAFYLPAMLRIGGAIDAARWVKAVAIYPRTELLKDQFAEAFRTARLLDQPLAARGRPLCLGALFGATPTRASRQELSDKKWPARGGAFVFPWMRCPNCGQDLVWREADIDAQIERLYCISTPCGFTVTQAQVALTRERLQREPPDLLFTTTEMLNQRLSDHWTRGVFGVGLAAAKRPFLGLLDEVHTYEGASGAQAALTLRRWRHLVSTPMAWVGLSATLQDASPFFGDLVGLDAERVVEITPSADEYEEEGAEYQILLRGDPTSRAALLSTTIQTAMLLPRLLDPPDLQGASGAFGRRAFLFTDDLDVTNRLFDDLRDAEAYDIFGRPDGGRRPLAHLRAQGPDPVLQDVEGQRWRACEDIGHPLDRRLVVGRTTSQDAGVNQTANVVVATAALEVGFNDPFVGAVIQHKAPRGMASFVQRKGRAGRDRAMRPITLTVLSDYGRDRAFYQAYEHLFDPSLEPQRLPVANPHILKIQAVYALFDWVGDRTAKGAKGWQWDLLSRVGPSGANRAAALARSREKLTNLIRGDAATIQDFTLHLMAALGVDEAGAQSLLWEAPRSLLLEAVPTLMRRLVRGWELAFPAGVATHDNQVDYHPLPDFAPRTLFGDLNLPEVRIVIPPATANHQEREEAMPVAAALNQLAPGRVTRRFAFERGALCHWAPVDIAHPAQQCSISTFAEENEFIGTFAAGFNRGADAQPYRVFRPWTIRLQSVARTTALPSSNARLDWRTDMVANGEALTVQPPRRSQWRRYLQSMDFYLHRFRSSVSVRRFAPAARANVRTLQHDHPILVEFTDDDGVPAALGFELDVDGFCLRLNLPQADDFAASVLPDQLLRSARVAFARDMLRENADWPVEVNSFQRDWLFQVLICALTAEAVASARTLAAVADDLLSEDRLEDSLRAVMDGLFSAVTPNILDDEGEEADEDGGDPHHSHGPSRLQQGLASHLANQSVRAQLRAAAETLIQPDAAQFSAWLRHLCLETVGEAALQACLASAPRQATVDTLVVDIREDAESGEASVWITETTLGGAGVLQAFAEKAAGEPHAFFAALEAALSPTDLELVDGSLRALMELSQQDHDVSALVAQMRATSSHAERADCWRRLSQRLAQHGGIDLSHAFTVSLNNRLLRAGTGPEVDQVLIDLARRWDAYEARLGLALGVREFAYICSRDEAAADVVRRFLRATLPAQAVGQVSILSALSTVLWPRADEVRGRVLQSYNPFRESGSADPALVRHFLLSRDAPIVLFEDPYWRDALQQAFETRGICRLSAEGGESARLRATLVELAATPASIGVMQFFPVVERVERDGARLMVTLTLREQV